MLGAFSDLFTTSLVYFTGILFFLVLFFCEIYFVVYSIVFDGNDEI